MFSIGLQILGIKQEKLNWWASALDGKQLDI
jgi:hypothetical protein